MLVNVTYNAIYINVAYIDHIRDESYIYLYFYLYMNMTKCPPYPSLLEGLYISVFLFVYEHDQMSSIPKLFGGTVPKSKSLCLR